MNLGYRIYEVPINYRARSREEGKKLTWMDGVHAIETLVRVRLRRRFDRSFYWDAMSGTIILKRRLEKAGWGSSTGLLISATEHRSL